MIKHTHKWHEKGIRPESWLHGDLDTFYTHLLKNNHIIFFSYKYYLCKIEIHLMILLAFISRLLYILILLYP